MPKRTTTRLEEDPNSNLDVALGVKGQLRVRPYGNVKHAHVVLRQVNEEDYVDTHGKKRKRAVFSLFAHKLINVKPGKELFLYLHPTGGELHEDVVALEADLPGADEEEAAEPVDSMKSEETLVQPEQVLPPRMRKHWMKRFAASPQQQPLGSAGTSHSDSSLPQTPTPASASSFSRPSRTETTIDDPTKPASSSGGMKERRSYVTVGVQVEQRRYPPEPSHSSIRLDLSSSPGGRPRRSTATGQRLPSSKCDVFTQTLDERILHPHFDVNTQTEHYVAEPRKGIRVHKPKAASKQVDAKALASRRADSIASSKASTATPSRQRTLSPMELDSSPASPDYSPELFCVDLADDVEEISPPKTLTRETADFSRLSSAATLVNRSSPLGGQFSSYPLDPAVEPVSSSNAPAPVNEPSRPFTDAAQTGASDAYRSLAANGWSYGLHPPIQPSAASAYPMHGHTPPLAHVAPAPFKFPLVRPPTQPTAPRALAKAASRVPRNQASNGPKVVPATSTSQPSTSFPSQVASSSLQPNHTPVATGYDYPQPASGGLKRSRPVNDDPDRVEGSLTPTKKWKAIVKAEPMSPVLPFSRNSDPVPDNLGDVYGTQPSGQASGQPITPAAITPTPHLSATDWPEALQIKAEALDVNLQNSMNQRGFSRNEWNRARVQYNPYAEQPHIIDLTSPTNSYGSGPPRTNSKRMRTKRGRQSPSHKLFARYSAHLKMKNNMRESGVREIVFDDHGMFFAIVCRDSTVRVWDNVYRTEIAKLSHSSDVVQALWFEAGKSIVSLGSNGVVSKWTMVGSNTWDWNKVVDTGDSEPNGLAYSHGRIAVCHARKGIRIWEHNLESDTWIANDRNIPRQDIASIKYNNDGSELLCGSFDGSVFRVTIPKCRVLPVTAMSTKCFAVEPDRDGKHALVAEAYGRAILIELAPIDSGDGAHTETRFSLRDAESRYGSRASHPFGALFAGNGHDYVVFGAVGGRVLVWDRDRGTIEHEMDHGPGALVQAAAFCESTKNEAQLLTCTRKGKLTWWDLPDDTSA